MQARAPINANWFTRLRLWLENRDAEVDVRRWLGWGIFLVLVGALMRTALIAIPGVVLMATGIAGRLWWDHALTGLSYEREFDRERAFFGDEVDMRLVAINAKPLPLSRVDVVEQASPLSEVRGHRLYPGTDTRNRRLDSLFSLGMYERVSQHYTLDCKHRGWQLFGPTELQVHDPFGAISRTLRVNKRSGVLVYPRMVPISGIAIAARQPLGDAKPATPLVEDPMLVLGTRPYVPGDSPRRIHWKATARTGEMQTRVFEHSASQVTALFLDTIAFSFLWDGQNSDLLELSVVATASLARDLIQAKQQVGLYANAPAGDLSRSVRIAPGRRSGQLQKMLEHLAMLQPAFGDRIENMIARELPQLPWGATIVIITTNATADFQRTLLRLARATGAKRFTLVLIGEIPDLYPEIARRFSIFHMSGGGAWDEIDSIQFTRL